MIYGEPLASIDQTLCRISRDRMMVLNTQAVKIAPSQKSSLFLKTGGRPKKTYRVRNRNNKTLVPNTIMPTANPIRSSAVIGLVIVAGQSESFL